MESQSKWNVTSNGLSLKIEFLLKWNATQNEISLKWNITQMECHSKWSVTQN